MMTNKKTTVDWDAYAEKYDMLLSYNPFYKELKEEVFYKMKSWKVKVGGTIVDLGAGTGNYSIEIARLFPSAQILHIDNNEGMNKIAHEKAEGLHNFQVIEQSVEGIDFENNSLHGLICINAIYTFPNPQKVLQKIYDWLRPGARAVIVDPGRIMSLLSWKISIGWHLIKNYGIRKTLKILKESEAVGKQNAFIRDQQKNGTYWTHTHAEFCDAVKKAGFQLESSSTIYRGDCDLVMVRKQ